MRWYTRKDPAGKIPPVSPETVRTHRPGMITEDVVRHEDIRLDTAEDLDAVRVLILVIKDETDEARQIVRAMSPKGRALLGFLLREAGRLVEEEDTFRDTADRRRARDEHPDIGDV